MYVVPVATSFLNFLGTLFSTALLTVDVFDGNSGVTLKKLPRDPDIPIEADGLDKAALVAPYLNSMALDPS